MRITEVSVGRRSNLKPQACKEKIPEMVIDKEGTADVFNRPWQVQPRQARNSVIALAELKDTMRKAHVRYARLDIQVVSCA